MYFVPNNSFCNNFSLFVFIDLPPKSNLKGMYFVSCTAKLKSYRFEWEFHQSATMIIFLHLDFFRLIA